MAVKTEKNSKNSAGNWYCTSPDSDDDGCIACGACYGSAEDFFAEDDDGNAYVLKQPTTDEEIAECQDALDSCPADAIGNDG